MAKLGDFIAFKATISLLERTDEGKLTIKDIYNKCKQALLQKRRTKKSPKKNCIKIFLIKIFQMR